MIVLRVSAVAAGAQIEPDWPRGNLERAAILHKLENSPGKHLVIVSYEPDHDLDMEWVYNAADIDAAKVVWARDMGRRDNAELLQYFSRPTGVALECRPVSADDRAMAVSRMRTESWLTAKRIRIHGLLLAVCLWTVYAVDMSTPGLLDRNGLVKGTDFLHFYTLGTLALQDRGDLLYDMRAQAELARKLVPQAPNSLYVSALRTAGFAVLRTLCPTALRIGAGRVACSERFDLRLLLLRRVEDMPSSSGLPLDSSHPWRLPFQDFFTCWPGDRPLASHCCVSLWPIWPCKEIRSCSPDWPLDRSFSNRSWVWPRQLCLFLHANGR